MNHKSLSDPVDPIIAPITGDRGNPYYAEELRKAAEKAKEQQKQKDAPQVAQGNLLLTFVPKRIIMEYILLEFSINHQCIWNRDVFGKINSVLVYHKCHKTKWSIPILCWYIGPSIVFIHIMSEYWHYARCNTGFKCLETCIAIAKFLAACSRHLPGFD